MENPFEIIINKLESIEKMLLDLKTKEDSADNVSEVLLETKEVLEKLKISPATLYNWRNQGKIPFHKIGRRVYYKESQILAALDVPVMKEILLRRSERSV